MASLAAEQEPTGSRACGVQQLGCTGLVALLHVGSSWTRDRTHVPALAGEFLPTEPPGQSHRSHF